MDLVLRSAHAQTSLRSLRKLDCGARVSKDGPKRRLVNDEPVVVHCYTTPVDIEDGRNLAALGEFCRKLGCETRQDEVGLVVGDEYFAIRDFTEGATT
jgi:hypothetical protein